MLPAFWTEASKCFAEQTSVSPRSQPEGRRNISSFYLVIHCQVRHARRLPWVWGGDLLFNSCFRNLADK